MPQSETSTSTHTDKNTPICEPQVIDNTSYSFVNCAQLKRKRSAEYFREYRSQQTLEQKKNTAETMQRYQSNLTSKQKLSKTLYSKAYQSRMTAEQKKNKAKYPKEYKSKLTAGQKQRNKQYMKEYMRTYRAKQSQKCSTVQDSIAKFHAIFSEGPVYTCSCCDQLWYKHSVTDAAKVRQSNTNVDKHLLGIYSSI